jgi:hypothetical protein
MRRAMSRSGINCLMGLTLFPENEFALGSGAFHDHQEVKTRMLVRVAKRTGLTPGDL